MGKDMGDVCFYRLPHLVDSGGGGVIDGFGRVPCLIYMFCRVDTPSDLQLTGPTNTNRGGVDLMPCVGN